ncbi:MAG TPA: dickkopf-related protein [Polyangiaceae bacterium]|nr:dickkopf-related protein [Polyangiaceae bacterium]
MLQVSFGRGKRALALGSFTAWVLAMACSTGQDQVQRTQPGPGGGDSGTGGETSNAGTKSNNGGSISIDPDDGGDFGEVASLMFDPPTATIVLDGATPGTAEYSLIAVDAEGDTLVVGAEALQFDRPDLASAATGSPVVLTSPGQIAGTGTLHAIYKGLEATATLEVQIIQRVVGTVDPAVADALDGDMLAADPLLTELLYPYTETVFPLGLTAPLIMWDAPNPTGDVYRVRLEQGNFTYDQYGAVDAPGQLRVDQAMWDRVTASNSGDPLTLTVSRYDSLTTTAYTSATQSYTIAPASLRGAIYYWTASGDGTERVGSIVRIQPGTGAMPEPLNEGRCMGCHSVSAQGNVLVATIEDFSAPSLPPYQHPFGGFDDPETVGNDDIHTRPWAAFSLPAGDLSLQTTKHGGSSALTPDGAYVVFGSPSSGDPVGGVAGSKYLSLAPTATGEVIANSGLDDLVPSVVGHQFLMPAFSPDGTKLAMVEAKVDLPTDNVLSSEEPASAPLARIVYIDFDQNAAGGPKFSSTLHEVARADAFPATNNGIAYPAFTADSQWIGFHTGEYAAGCHAPWPDGCLDSTPDAGELWMAKVDGTQLIRLDKANDPPLLADQKVNREPTFNPEKRGGYSWMVFTSMRNWGNDATITGPAINGKRRLWVAAVDGEIGTTDPSHPGFYIEGQDNETPNMRGFWALSQCIPTPPPAMPEDGACTAGFECCSGFCIEGVCSDPVGLTCVGLGEACTADAECCNHPPVNCIDNVCAIPPPPK